MRAPQLITELEECNEKSGDREKYYVAFAKTSVQDLGATPVELLRQFSLQRIALLTAHNDDFRYEFMSDEDHNEFMAILNRIRGRLQTRVNENTEGGMLYNALTGR